MFALLQTLDWVSHIERFSKKIFIENHNLIEKLLPSLESHANINSDNALSLSFTDSYTVCHVGSRL